MTCGVDGPFARQPFGEGADGDVTNDPGQRAMAQALEFLPVRRDRGADGYSGDRPVNRSPVPGTTQPIFGHFPTHYQPVPEARRPSVAARMDRRHWKSPRSPGVPKR